MDMSTSILKDTFYREKLIHLSVTSGDIDDSKNEEKKRLKELSRNALSLETIEEGLSNFGKTADGASYGFLAINMSGMSLYSIIVKIFLTLRKQQYKLFYAKGLEEYLFLQHVELSNNNLMTLKPLSTLKYITYLDVSNNKLTKLFDFKYLIQSLFI
jgi:Leucine-rich repeat (LRR) protein